MSYRIYKSQRFFAFAELLKITSSSASNSRPPHDTIPNPQKEHLAKTAKCVLNPYMDRSQALTFLQAAIRPAVRFCLRHALQLQDVIEAAKTVFVEEAAAMLEREEGKATTSQLSVVSGLQRRDIVRIREGNVLEESHYPQGLLTRVVGQWLYDPRFSRRNEKARPLAVTDGTPSFKELVESVSLDVNSGTVLKELLRLGQVTRDGDTVTLTAKSFTPRKDPRESLALMASDTSDLVHAVEGNISTAGSSPNLHAKTEYDHIAEDLLPEVRSWFLKEGMALHQRAREYLSQLDGDVNPERKATGARFRVALGTFSIIAPHVQQTVIRRESHSGTARRANERE